MDPCGARTADLCIPGVRRLGLALAAVLVVGSGCAPSVACPPPGPWPAPPGCGETQPGPQAARPPALPPAVSAPGLPAPGAACPPPGPWPVPPGCGGTQPAPQAALPPASSAAVVAPGLPAPAQTQAPAPAAPAPKLGPYGVAFTVSVPASTPPQTRVYLQIIKGTNEWVRSTKMEQRAPNTWYLAADLRDFKDTQIAYRYMRDGWGYPGAEQLTPDTKTASRTVLVEERPKEVSDAVAKWRWVPEPAVAAPKVASRAASVPFAPRVDGQEYQKGALIVDFWWGNFADLLDSTHQRLKTKGFGWAAIMPNWDYTTVDPAPVIGAVGYTDAAIDLQLRKMKESGLKIYLSPQICCTSADRAGFSAAWWEAWYRQYEAYALYFAQKAKAFDVDTLVLAGDWIAADKQPAGYRERIEAIYAKVRAVYGGKMGRYVYLGGAIDRGIPDLWPSPASLPYADIADFFAISWWVGLTTRSDPSQAELDAKAKEIVDLRLGPLYERYHKPIVLQQVAYPSVDGGLTGKVAVDDPNIEVWGPPTSTYALDLAEQAMGYEAMMTAVAATPYLVGLYPFSYWPSDFPATKEHNIRGKPAEDVLAGWFAAIR